MIKRIVWVGIIALISYLLVRWFNHDFAKGFLFKKSAELGVYVFVFSSLIGPLSVIFPKVSFVFALQKFRREIGVTAGLLILVYIMCFFISVPDWTSFTSLFSQDAFIPVLWFGIPSLLVLLLTSNNYSVRKLGYMRWKQVHKLVYILQFSIIWHLMVMGKDDLVWKVFVPLVCIQIYRLYLKKQRSLEKILKSQ